MSYAGPGIKDKIPSIKGKVLTKDKGTTTYILYQYGFDYKPDKKYAIPKHTIIGKVGPTDKSRMYPNEKFQEYFPEVVFPEELSEAYRNCCLWIGFYIVIRYVLNEYKFPKLLERWFPKDSGLLMDLVSYLIVDEENAGQYYPDFAFCYSLFCVYVYSVFRTENIYACSRGSYSEN